MHIEFGGGVRVGLTDADDVTERYVRRQFYPLTASGGPADGSDVVIAQLAERRESGGEVLNTANDGVTTVSERGRLSVVWDGLRCTVPDVFGPTQPRFEYEPGFPLWRVFRSAVRPAIQIRAALSGRAVLVHAASVTIDEGAVLVGGWSESGKTEAALGLVERGAAFLSDKWTVAEPAGTASVFPMTVGVRRWALNRLPKLAASTTRSARLQFMGARAASALVGGVAGLRANRPNAGRVIDGLRRITALADRAAFDLDDIRAAYGQTDDPLRRVPIRLVVVLENAEAGPPVARPITPAVATARLARAAAFERRSYLELLQRAGFTDTTLPPSGLEAAIAADAVILEAIFNRTPVVAVRAPFPTDPRTVADVILRELGR